MSFTLLLNSSNVIGVNNNTFKYNFITGSFKAQDHEMCVSSVVVPYSFFNITKSYGNNTFTIAFPVSGLADLPPTPSKYLEYHFTLPDGYYSVTDIQNYIELKMIENGLYLINSTKQNVYGLQLSYNFNYYAIQLIANLIPTTLETGWTLPSNFPSQGLPQLSLTPRLFLNKYGSIASVIGFVSDAYYPKTLFADISVLSTLPPNGATVNALVLRSDLVNNNITVPSDILDAVPLSGTTFGSNIIYEPKFERFVAIRDGTYSSMVLSFSDQNLGTIYANDPTVSIALIIRKKK